MLAILKLLASLAEAIPALKDIIMDVAGMLTEWNASRRLRDKDEAVDIAINDITNRMRNAQLRKRSKDNEPR
jgi:hypothetical protein